MKNRLVLFSVILIIVLIFEFLYLNPFGIKVGYFMSGGASGSDEHLNADELLRDYEEAVSTYQL